MASPYIITGPTTIGTTATNTIINGGVITETGSTSITDTVGSSSTTLLTGSYAISSVSTSFTNAATNVISNFVTTTAGDLLYQSGAPSVVSRLPIGANTTVLTSNGTVPSWVVPTDIAGSAGSFVFYSADTTPTTSTQTTLAAWTASAPFYNNAATFDITTGIFTALVAGNYHFDANVVWENSVTNGGLRQISFYLNGTVTVVTTSTLQPSGNSAIKPTMKLSCDPNLGIGDTIRLRVFQDSGVSTVKVLGGATVGTTIAMFRLT